MTVHKWEERRTVYTTIGAELLQHRQQLLGFVRRKVGDSDLGEDIFQDSRLNALHATPGLCERGKLLPWFYTILNNAVAGTLRVESWPYRPNGFRYCQRHPRTSLRWIGAIAT